MKKIRRCIVGITLLILIGCDRRTDIKDAVIPLSEINYNVSENRVLIVSGKGKIVKEQLISSLWDKGYTKDDINRVIITDGITSIGKSAFDGFQINSVEIANSVKIIDVGAFSGCDLLQEVKMSDGVEEIRQDAFSSCSSLRTFILPNSLKHFDESALSDCGLLIEIKNKSSHNWKLSSVAMMKGDWYCDGKQVDCIPAEKTIAIKPIIYQIQYNLNGGEATKKLPMEYKHTQGCKLPNTVRRKGYSFVQWIIDQDKTDTIFPGETGNKNVKAIWINFQLENLQSGIIRAYWKLDTKQIKKEEKTYFCVIRYSSDVDMSDFSFIESAPDKSQIKIKKMMKGKNYYVEYAVIEDLDDYDTLEELPWQGKQSIMVR